ncbi:MAG: GNAT family N-acetyltransferase [Victivallales bacterium]|nr:GNAT family N-acetyltransferase [Victivallales bacterium]
MEGNPHFHKIERKEELPLVRTLADQVWPDTFRPILPPPQIPYMMEMMYSLPVMEKEFDEGVSYYILFIHDKPAGYLQLSPYHPEGTAKLHKIYLLQEHQGKGYGSFLIQFGLDTLRKEGFQRAILNVNKHNDKAIRSYFRNGFTIAETVKNDIGNGFFMDDFVMEHPL